MSTDLPSWCPDWRTGPAAEPLSNLLYSSGSPIYPSSGKTIATFNNDTTIGLLGITGMSIGSIQHCSDEAYDLRNSRQSDWEMLLGDADRE